MASSTLIDSFQWRPQLLSIPSIGMAICVRTFTAPRPQFAGSETNKLAMKVSSPRILISCLLIHTTIGQEWGACSRDSGVCINTSLRTCTTSTRSGQCPGPANIRCCPAPGGIQSSQCSARGGTCMRSVTCASGSTRTGLCPGPASVTCCLPPPIPQPVPRPVPIPRPVPTPTPLFRPPSPDTRINSGTCRSAEDRFFGYCIPKSKCTGGTFNGQCPGNDFCCVRETRAVKAVVPASGTTALISRTEFRSLFTGISATRAYALYPYFIDSLNVAGINSCRRLAAYVGQLGHESAGLLYFEELASGSAYEGRTDLGNVQAGDGTRFKGRGPIQLTGRNNYSRAAQALGRDFVNTPDLVGMPSGGFAASAWYWSVHVRNADADAGTQSGYDRITVAINGCGGRIANCNGVADRNQRWLRARQVLGC